MILTTAHADLWMLARGPRWQHTIHARRPRLTGSDRAALVNRCVNAHAGSPRDPLGVQGATSLVWLLRSARSRDGSVVRALTDLASPQSAVGSGLHAAPRMHHARRLLRHYRRVGERTTRLTDHPITRSP